MWHRVVSATVFPLRGVAALTSPLLPYSCLGFVERQSPRQGRIESYLHWRTVKGVTARFGNRGERQTLRNMLPSLFILTTLYGLPLGELLQLP